jgi:GGDEF domain-containing protein
MLHPSTPARNANTWCRKSRSAGDASSDLAARVGGSEFALLLGDNEFEEAQTQAEVIIAAVAT